MKLSYKIFVVYLLVSFILLLSVFATLEIYVTRHFKAVETMMEKEMFTDLAYALAIDYQEQGNWNRFVADPDVFRRFVRTSLSGKSGMFPPPGPPGPHDRISLFTADRVKITGPDTDDSHLVFKPILINGEPVGWLGFGKSEHRPPLFFGPSISERLKIFYTIGVILFLLAGVVSYLLSRHILSPVKKLTEGTKALTRFKFHTRIPVSTKDELGHLAMDFNRMAVTLERYETMRKQWIVDISHELRTPLSILKGEIEALQDGIRTLTKPGIDSLHDEVTHLETLVNGLHLLSMADSDALAMTTEKVNPIKILKSVLTLFEPRLKQKQLSLNTVLDNTNLILSGNNARLKQLFSNIIENNIKYTRKPGTITIWNKVHHQTLFMGIEDSGPGVPPSSLEKIFDRLYRIDPSRNRKQVGSGLGLSICKTIAQAHGGDITATLTETGGLRITIQLPMA